MLHMAGESVGFSEIEIKKSEIEIKTMFGKNPDQTLLPEKRLKINLNHLERGWFPLPLPKRFI
jgi:hypothetical protein